MVISEKVLKNCYIFPAFSATMEAGSLPSTMEADTSVSSMGSINLDAKPKKSILKRSEPEEAAELAEGGGGEEGAEAGRRHVPFSRIIPELSRLEEEDARLGSAAAAGTSDLQSVSSAASLSPLSSDEQLDGAEADSRPGAEPVYSGYVPPLRRPEQRSRRARQVRRRARAHGPHGPPVMGPDVGGFPPHGSLSPRLRSVEERSPSPLRLVRYSPSPERRDRYSRSPSRRSPGRRSLSRRTRSRSPRRRSRSPGRYRRGPSPPRYGRSPGRRRWSRSPSRDGAVAGAGAGTGAAPRPGAGGEREMKMTQAWRSRVSPMD